MVWSNPLDLFGVQRGRMGDDQPPIGAEGHPGSRTRSAPGSVRVDGPEAAGAHGQQLGEIRGGQRPDEMQRGGLDVGLVGFGVLTGVIDQRELVARCGQSAPKRAPVR